ncbi:3'-5' exonuclease [Weissella hellenica]|uniref:3'-5' exonuclease n=1 Tax=Weissella hellenica TaxID=46256 RepID=UPI003884804C
MSSLVVIVVFLLGLAVWGVISVMVEGYKKEKQKLEVRKDLKTDETDDYLSENTEIFDEHEWEDSKSSSNHTDLYDEAYLNEIAKEFDHAPVELPEKFRERIEKEMEQNRLDGISGDDDKGETKVPLNPDEPGYQEFYLATERTGFVFDKDYVVVDIETTGFDYLKNKIVEISAVRVRNHEVVDHFQGFNKKSKLSTFLKESSPITFEDIKGGLPIEELLQKFLAFIGDDTMVGHKIGFDLDFLRYNLHYYGFGDLTNEFVDTMLMGKYFANSNWGHHRVDDYIAHYPNEVNFDNLQQHSAYNDVLIEQRIYEVERGILGDDFSHEASRDMLWAMPKVRVVETDEEITTRITSKKMDDAIRTAIDDKDYAYSNQLIEEIFDEGITDHSKLYKRMALNYKKLKDNTAVLQTIIRWQSNMGGQISKTDAKWIQEQMDKLQLTV